ncbi:MAG: acyl-CoA thioesterase [Bacteroidetes bacterium]|nr:acyl-CoA thioesterase [Bacteroidota bacterium]
MQLRPSSFEKIRFHDCDMFGHLNNARFIDYMINARQEHLVEAYGFNIHDFYRKQLGWVISTHEIAYLRPAVFDERVIIESQLLHLGKDHLCVEIAMLNEERSHYKSILRSRLTFINLKTGKKELHPEEFMIWAQQLADSGRLVEMTLQERVGMLLGKRDE